MNPLRFLKYTLTIVYAISSVVFSSATYSPPAHSETPDERAQSLQEQLSKRAVQNQDRYYDEIFDQDGKLRPQYEDIFYIYAKKSPAELKRIKKKTKKSFQGDNALAAIPRILTNPEYKTLSRGVRQRGRALLLFLKDHYSNKNYLRDRIIPAEVMKRVILRSGERSFEGLITPDQISFPYGPDIIRDVHGNWRVLEDNPGFIGGVGDLIRAREILFEEVPEYKEKLPDLKDPSLYYKTLLIAAYTRLKNKSDAIVFYTSPPYVDNEDLRLKKIWDSFGVEVVTPYTNKKLVHAKDGMYLQWTDSSTKTIQQKKVGYVFFNAEYDWGDPTHPATEKMFLEKTALQDLAEKGRYALNPNAREELLTALSTQPIDYKKIRHILVHDSAYIFDLHEYREKAPRGFTESVLAGDIATNYTPGVELIGDKEFYTYVEDLIRYYLNEEPILKNIPTARLYKSGRDGQLTIAEDVFNDLKINFNKKVAKIVDGRGGDGVWVGSKIAASQKNEALDAIAKMFDKVIVQDFVHLSVIANDITDLRMISQVDSDKNGKARVIVATTPWSRGVPMEGNGKVNLSSQGHELAVIVPPSPKKFKTKKFKTKKFKTKKFKKCRDLLAPS